MSTGGPLDIGWYFTMASGGMQNSDAQGGHQFTVRLALVGLQGGGSTSR